jgi:hypothetical protein
MSDLRMAGNTPDITPTSAMQEMARLSRQLDAEGSKIRELVLDAVRKRHAYTIGYAKALVAADGSNAEIRKAQATLATDELLLAAVAAEAELDIIRSNIRDILHRRVDVGRSVFSFVKSEAALIR